MSPVELRARRIRLGLSQPDLALIFGVKQATVSRWESGARPVPLGIGPQLELVEDVFDGLLERLDGEGPIRASAAIEVGGLWVGDEEVPVPVSMVLAAAGELRWMQDVEFQDGQRDEPPSII